MTASAVLAAGYEDNMFLPLYSLSAEEIFTGNILLFDVDFFNPRTEYYALTEKTTSTSSTTTSVDGTSSMTQSSSSEPVEGRIVITKDTNIEEELDHSDEISQDTQSNGGLNEVTTTTTIEKVKYYYYLKDPNLPDEEENRVITSRQNIALDLQSIISKWYLAIRNIAIVLSMSVLLYIGIRMLLSSVSQEKAKYKQMLIDWTVGICLLFFLHYIMTFSVTIVKQLNEVVSTAKDNIIDQVVLLEDDEKKYISTKVEEIGKGEYIDKSTNPAQILWPTNLTGMLRIKAQVSYGDIAFVGYGISYAILILFTVYFVFVYLKRVLYMAFLTMIAPLVALTYPIDKISDGQAQGFNKWLKEYLFNLLLQPLHLLLYTILVTSAYELSSTNAIYSLVAIGFLIPAEKLMRSLFGFEKASTPGSAAGAAAGAAMLNSGLQKLLHKPPTRKGEGKGGNGSDSEEESSLRTGYKSADIESSGNSDAGGASAADAARYNKEEDPIKRMEREALEEQIADGQLNEKELTAEQRALLGMENEEQDGNDGDHGENGDNNSQIRLDENGQGDEKNVNQEDGEEQQSIRQRIKNRVRTNKAANKDYLQRMGRTAKFTAKQGARKLTKMAPKAIRGVAKGAAGLAVGATAAAIGATVGIATGDPSKVASFAGGAALAGGALGASRVNMNPSQTKSAAQIARERVFWGEDYDNHIAEENKKKWKKNSNMREQLEKSLGADRVKKLYENGDIDNYLDHNVNDPKMIAAMEKVMQNNSNLKFNDVLAFKEGHDLYGNGTNRMGSKSRKEAMEDYTRQFKERGLSNEKSNAGAERICNGIDLISSELR